MNKILIVIFLLLLPLNFSMAETTKKNIRGRGLRVTPRTVGELKESIKSRKNSLRLEMETMDEIDFEIHEKQNRFKNGVQNLMIMENMIENVGFEVSLIADELNLSLKNTLKYEEEFKRRGKIKKIFFGQKKDIIDKFSIEIKSRKDGVKKLNNIYENSSLAGDIKDIFYEQLISINEEQERIEEYFRTETKHKGILTWFINIFN